MTTIAVVKHRWTMVKTQKGKNTMFDRQTKKFCSAVIEALPEVLEDIMQGWIANPRGLQKVLSEALLPPSRRPLDAWVGAFFALVKYVHVLDDFRNRILVPALDQPPTQPAQVGKPFNLVMDMTDTLLQEELGSGHVFQDAKAFCLYLQAAIEKQRDGNETGDLLVNGANNIFYVRGKGGEIFTAQVHCRAGRQKWGLDANRRSSETWKTGDRAFPCKK